MDFMKTIEAFARVRVGRVLTPTQISEEAASCAQAARFKGYGLAIRVPNWLVTEFEQQKTTDHRFDVFSAPGSPDNIGMFILQSRNTQLRIVMRMGDALVQQFFVDCMHRGRLFLLFEPENTAQLVALEVPGSFLEPDLILSLIRDSKTCAKDVKSFVKLTCLLAEAGGAASLIEGQAVTDVISVLVADEQVAEALQSEIEEPAKGAHIPEQTLH